MAAFAFRIPDALDKPLREAAAGASSLNDYTVRAVRRQMLPASSLALRLSTSLVRATLCDHS
ncbi:hypothetical protein AB0N62_45725 [Streptomyces sp. NPDC093982]|uniref:hypothetical protein n=1 Tax=Streptomyces sp. NPDC093982 TaxID=3155077 RepID=UPI00342A003F